MLRQAERESRRIDGRGGKKGGKQSPAGEEKNMASPNQPPGAQQLVSTLCHQFSSELCCHLKQKANVTENSTKVISFCK